MTASVQREGSRVLVRCWGEIDLATADEMERALREAFDDTAGSVVLDLGPVTFMDCSGLRVLLSADRQARTGGRRLVLTGTGPRVRRLLRYTGTEEQLVGAQTDPGDGPPATER